MRCTLDYGQYQLAYEVYGSGDRVLVWLHGLLLDANLSRGLARRLAARGNRVVLLDLLGHGRSDKPRHAGAHRMDLYAEQVLCLLDELDVDQVVLGGVSLGTNVSLLATVQAPGRVRGLVLEMPVLEWAAPAAALVFAPLLLEVHYARAPLRLVSRVASHLPPSGLGPLDSFVSAVASDPDEIAAVLHGVLLGPIAPTIDQRRAITAPALVLGHGVDLIHSFSDAKRLARQLPDARLIRTRTFAELWLRPARLTGEISGSLTASGLTPNRRSATKPRDVRKPSSMSRGWLSFGRCPPTVPFGGCQQLGYAVLDALGEHVKVGVGREVAGDPEGDVIAVAEDRDPGADRGDRHIGDDLQKPAPHDDPLQLRPSPLLPRKRQSPPAIMRVGRVVLRLPGSIVLHAGTSGSEHPG